MAKLPNHPEEGIYYDVPAEVYRSWPYMNASVIKAGAKSMLEAHHARNGGGDESASMAWGSLLHRFVLEGSGNIVAFPGKVRRGKDFEEFKTRHGDAWIITGRELDGCNAAKDRIMEHGSASVLIGKACVEVSIVWRDELTSMMCKARLDGLCDTCWFDYKTTRSIEAGQFYRQAYSLGWHLQMAHYRAGINQLTGKDLDVYIIGQESKAPFDVRVFRIGSHIMTPATLRRDQIMGEIDWCIFTNKWPGISEEVTEFELPEWAAENNAELEWGEEREDESGEDPSSGPN
jgi:hypothetical protein